MVQVTALFKKAGKAAAPAKAKTSTAVKKVAAAPKPRRSSGGDNNVWIPNGQRPEWLDGSLPGDRGFDPLGLGKPAEYLQVDVDQLDQNKGVNKPGRVIGTFTPVSDVVSTDRLQPYSEVFGLARFRENELQHGRWAMLAALGIVWAELATGLDWHKIPAAELAGATYFGNPLPWTPSQITWSNTILIGGAEIFRNTQLDTEKRCYPGGFFDPLNLASDADPARAFKLKEAELKHGRLAMIACLGFAWQALQFDLGALSSLRAAL